MGVPGLQTWLKRRYPDAFVPLPDNFVCDHLYLDMSSTLHQVIRRARTKQYFHILLHRRLDEILAAAQPRQSVVLALDGPAPLAKLLEQRRRRRRESEKAQRRGAAAAEAAESAATAAAKASAAAAAAADAAGRLGAADGFSTVVPTAEALALAQFRPPNPELSTLALTTGSLLMLEVHSSLSAYICKKLAEPTTAHLRFELSDSTVKGEGELKILSRLLQPSSNGSGSTSQRQPQDETHLILGADSDLLLMALVAGQRSVYILPDLQEEGKPHRHRLWHHTDRHGRPYQPGAGFWRAPSEAVPAVPAPSTPSDSEASGIETDSELSSEEDSDSEVMAAVLAAAAAAAEEEEAPPPPLLAFSRDAAERLWREQHLGGGTENPDLVSEEQQQLEVTTMALDLMLLALMCSGDDYLPAIQGMQLSNKHRPGLWDLYTHLRQEPEWRGQSLVARSSTPGGGVSATVHLNAGMLHALLAEYHRQRFIYMDAPVSAEAGHLSRSDSSLNTGGASPGGGSSVLSSGTLPGSGPVVWDREGLAMAAAMATSSPPDDSLPPGGGRQRQNITLRGMDAHPEGYMQGLGWVLGMYCSGAVGNYRFTYDLAAPSLPQLLQALAAQQEAQQQCASSSSSEDGGGAASRAAGKQQDEGTAARPRHRSLQPLLPAACAMALLPRGGRIHAATALRHLMDEGSELEEIYATCDTCAHLGQQLGTRARELDGARSELVAVQLQLITAQAEASAGQRGAAEAVVTLQVQAERQDAEVARLRVLLSHLSRSQQEHLNDAHPYKPFPTEQLEAAVAAIPLESYPWHERRLVQFGREFVYCRAEGAAAPAPDEVAAACGAGGVSWRQRSHWAAVRRREVAAAAAPPASGGSMAGGSDDVLLTKPLLRPLPLQPGQAAAAKEQPGWVPLQPWVKECLSFAAAYPRVADPLLIRRSNLCVQRNVLPLRPYMQLPPLPGHQSPGGSTTHRASAVSTPCQLQCWDLQHGPRCGGGGGGGGGQARRHIKPHSQHGSRPLQLHTRSLASGGSSGNAWRAVPVRTAMLHGCTHLLSTLPRMLHVF